jgi:hypothetical protein
VMERLPRVIDEMLQLVRHVEKGARRQVLSARC